MHQILQISRKVLLKVALNLCALYYIFLPTSCCGNTEEAYIDLDLITLYKSSNKKPE